MSIISIIAIVISLIAIGLTVHSTRTFIKADRMNRETIRTLTDLRKHQ